MEKNYKYDAFISYRHSELDKYVAENLHRILENYELPKNLKEKLGIEGKVFKRIFRDREELPLSSNLEDPIVAALKESKYLIVICSPRLKDSLWCKKEIETFKKLRGRKNIFCVLIEGEPDESFPEEVLFDEDEKKNKILVEPLAADVRGKTKKEVLKKIKEEKIRLVASMLNIDYDDLKQRHKQREQKRKLMIIGSVAIFFILFSLYSSIMLIKINSQQKTLKLHQALTLSENSTKSLNNDSRYDAIKSSYEALTRFNGVKMPYTSEAEYALTEALRVYDTSSAYKSISEIKTEGVVDFIKESPGSKYILIYDESETLSLWNTKTLKKVVSFTDIPNFSMDEYTFTFVGDNLFAYITSKGNVKVISTKDGKLVNEFKRDEDTFISIKGSYDGSYLVYETKNKLFVYDSKSNKVLGSYSCNEYFNDPLFFSEDYKTIFVTTEENYYDLDNNKLTMRVIDVNTQKEINNYIIEAGYISGMYSSGDNVYMLLNSSEGIDYSLVAMSYNYKENKVNWTYKQDKVWGKYIYQSLAENVNHVLLVHTNKLDILDESGNLLQSFDTKSEILNIYGFSDEEIYLAFNADGSVNYIDMEKRTNMNYAAKFDFNVEEYSKTAKGEKGFFMVPYNDNRVITYEVNTNKNLKEVNKELKQIKTKLLGANEIKELKEKYNVKNKSLVSKMFYSDKKEYLFVYYTNSDLAIYNVKDKTLLNTVTGLHDADSYFGKDKYGRIYVGDLSYAYIIDSNYNKVGRVYRLYTVEKDKLYISINDKYYSLPIFTLEDLLKEAKEYLK